MFLWLGERANDDQVARGKNKERCMGEKEIRKKHTIT